MKYNQELDESVLAENLGGIEKGIITCDEYKDKEKLIVEGVVGNNVDIETYKTLKQCNTITDATRISLDQYVYESYEYYEYIGEGKVGKDHRDRDKNNWNKIERLPNENRYSSEYEERALKIQAKSLDIWVDEQKKEHPERKYHGYKSYLEGFWNFKGPYDD
ncbi:MAG: hypothetical protein IKR12_00095, partial [Clostridia bacterium]|nr:hypothetical protein [Clostridia bacterium]